jgi:DNA repair protein RadD
LVNVNVLTEGFDATGIDSVVLLRATVSPGLYYQMVGRGLRIDDSKANCLVLDFGGNIQRHGTIDNLKVKAKKVGDVGESPVKACPECDSMIHAGLLVCPDCSYEFPPPPPNHDASASDDSPLGVAMVEEHEVTEVTYQVHQKRGHPDAPKTMRVTYWDGVNLICDEWICVEHTGFAYEKAFSWWFARAATETPMPPKAVDAVLLAQQGALAKATAIKVRTKPGEKYKQITGYTLTAKPSPVHFREPGCDDEVVDRDDSFYAEYTGGLPF